MQALQQSTSSPVRIKLLWFLPVEWAVVEYTDWDDDGCSFGDSDSIDHRSLLTIAVRSVQDKIWTIILKAPEPE